MDNVLKVGMADLQASRHPCVITTLGLGSCVGIALYDTGTKVTGLAHIMLPWSQQSNTGINPAKFADTAVDKLIKEMIFLGAKRERIVAKLAGGAQMFSFGSSLDIMRIGARNIAASKEVLDLFNIPVVAEDTGGNYGRTIEIHSSDGKLVVKTIGYGLKEI